MQAEHIAAMLGLVERFLGEQVALEPGMKPVESWKEHMEGFLRRVLTKDDYHARVLTANGNLIGFILCGMSEEPTYEKGRIGYIADCYIIPELRRHGLGRKLVEDARSILKTAGADTIQLNVLAKNDAAVAFWKQMGFSTYMYRMKEA